MPLLESPQDVMLFWAFIGYLLGSIPFGLILARVFGLGDLRKVGSGNIGATNVLRTGNKAAAALTLLLDGAKGAAAVLLARMAAPDDTVQVAALAAFLGHCFPVWLGFKGGKGVATFLGVWLAYAWPVGLLCCATWAVTVAITRISSMGALMAASASTIFVFYTDNGQAMLLGMILTLLVFARHSANIARIKAKTEPKIGSKG
jgi:glycerol-3-phosphate acyltransferase PlsY